MITRSRKLTFYESSYNTITISFLSGQMFCKDLNIEKKSLWHILHIFGLIAMHMHFYDKELRNEDREVGCRICPPVGTLICHIDDLDVSDSITVARVSLGPWHSPLASGVL